MIDQQSQLLEAALHYAELGYAVFPCKTGTKNPATPHGHLDASSDPATIRSWWRKQPTANIGLPMQVNGLVAIDPDLYKPDCQWSAYIQGKPLPATWRQRSARGGLHFIFRVPQDAAFPGKLARHVDVKSDGYIVVAPSVFGTGTYERIGNAPPAPAPEWLLCAEGFSETGGSGKLDWQVDDATGLVADGREAFLTALIFIEYVSSCSTAADEIARRAWEQFEHRADLSRPTKLTYRDALKKARHILKKKPDISAKRTRLIEGIEPDPTPDELSASEATALLDRTLDDFLAEVGWGVTSDEILEMDPSQFGPEVKAQPPRLLIAGAAGLGKSRAILVKIRERNRVIREQLAEAEDRSPVWYVAPTIALCEELAAFYGAGAAVIRGRTHGIDDPKLTTPCERPRDVKVVTDAGIHNVAEALCETWVEVNRVKTQLFCPCRNRCGYYAQFENNPNAEVYFLSHEQLFTQPSYKKMGKPELLVIDESPLSSLVKSGRAFSPEDIVSDELGKLIVDELRAGRDPRPAAVGNGWTRASIRKHVTELDENATPVITPNMATNRIRHLLKGFKPSVLPTMLRKFSDELLVEHEGLRCLSYNPDEPVKAADGSVSKGERIRLHYRRPIQLLRSDLPVLVLDATGDDVLLEPALPGLTGVTIPAARNALVRQTFGFTASMGKMNGDDTSFRDEISGALRDAAKVHASGLLVTYKDAEKDIALPAGWESEHFGNLRGIDKHKDKPAVVVVGRLQVRATSIEKIALGLFYDCATKLTTTGTYQKRPVGFRMRSGDKSGVEADRHSCETIDRVRYQFTEAEIIQAVDRVRLVHSDMRKDVWLFNEVPTPIVIDHLASYRKQVQRRGNRGAGSGPGPRLVEAYKRLGGFIPLNHEWLAGRFEDIWVNANAVRMEIKNCTDRQTVQDLSELFGGGVVQYKYRLKGQRGAWPSRLYSDNGIEAVHAFIQAEVGELERAWVEQS